MYVLPTRSEPKAEAAKQAAYEERGLRPDI